MYSENKDIELERTSEKRKVDTPYFISSFFAHECGEESEARKHSILTVFITDQVNMIWEELLEKKKESSRFQFSKVNTELYGIFVSF